MNRCNVGMIQRCEDFRFALEPRHAFGIARERFGQDFQRHIAPELRIPCAVHLAHPACANSGKDFVRADAIARGQNHSGLDYSPSEH